MFYDRSLNRSLRFRAWSESMVTTWAISPYQGPTPAAVIGRVDAPDAESAIKEAIRQFNITDPEQQKRLVARPIR